MMWMLVSHLISALLFHPPHTVFALDIVLNIDSLLYILVDIWFKVTTWFCSQNDKIVA
jgi:hypothetical protein